MGALSIAGAVAMDATWVDVHRRQAENMIYSIFHNNVLQKKKYINNWKDVELRIRNVEELISNWKRYWFNKFLIQSYA